MTCMFCLLFLYLIPQLGGSFATIPRIAHRRSVRNFYQHNYPYAWVGARVVYDV
jgi:L-histidine Nalpha-methyltransferase / hercynylcysteine S-oxide synthase